MDARVDTMVTIATVEANVRNVRGKRRHDNIMMKTLQPSFPASLNPHVYQQLKPLPSIPIFPY